jgi:hypothetical protein
MSLAVRKRVHWLAFLPALVSCQAFSGLGDLEIVGDGTGAQGTGAVSGTGGGVGSGGGSACLVGWEANATCKGVCGDPGDGIRVGCGNFMDCYVDHDCLPETCSQDIDDVCGINEVQSGTNESLVMAQEVVTCLCDP